MQFLGTLQEEHKPWRVKNFPDSPPHQPMLGLVEEYGELIAAINAHDLTGNAAEIEDAVGDIFVFAADFCSRHGLSLQDVYRQAEYPITVAYGGKRIQILAERTASVALGNLAHTVLKKEQGIRGSDAYHQVRMVQFLGTFLKSVDLIAEVSNVTTENAIKDTWFRVCERDWSKNRTNGEV